MGSNAAEDRPSLFTRPGQLPQSTRGSWIKLSVLTLMAQSTEDWEAPANAGEPQTGSALQSPAVCRQYEESHTKPWQCLFCLCMTHALCTHSCACVCQDARRDQRPILRIFLLGLCTHFETGCHWTRGSPICLGGLTSELGIFLSVTFLFWDYSHLLPYLAFFRCWGSELRFSCLSGRYFIFPVLDVLSIRPRIMNISPEWCFSEHHRRKPQSLPTEPPM